MIEIILAASTGNVLLVGVLVAMVFAVAYGLFTVNGSGIGLHRYSSPQTPGAGGPSEVTGIDQGQGSATGSDATGHSDPQHGTR